MLDKVEEIRHDDKRSVNRLGVLLGNAKCAQTKTLTHVLWSLLNSIPGNSVQRPHRHNSVALDLCVSASPNVYTLMGREIDENGLIIDPIRCDWAPGGVFVTPPGWWHSHHNESDDVAWVLPIQDAGLFTHQRTLDIRFVDDELALHHAGRIRGSAFVVTDDQFNKLKELGGTGTNQECDAEVITNKASDTKYNENMGLDVIEDDSGDEDESSGDDEKKVNDTAGTAKQTPKRRSSIQVGHLARQQLSPSTCMTTESGVSKLLPAPSHRRRKSIQVGADLKYLKKSIVRSSAIAF